MCRCCRHLVRKAAPVSADHPRPPRVPGQVPGEEGKSWSGAHPWISCRSDIIRQWKAAGAKCVSVRGLLHFFSNLPVRTALSSRNARLLQGRPSITRSKGRSTWSSKPPASCLSMSYAAGRRRQSRVIAKRDGAGQAGSIDHKRPRLDWAGKRGKDFTYEDEPY